MLLPSDSLCSFLLIHLHPSTHVLMLVLAQIVPDNHACAGSVFDTYRH